MHDPTVSRVGRRQIHLLLFCTTCWLSGAEKEQDAGKLCAFHPPADCNRSWLYWYGGCGKSTYTHHWLHCGGSWNAVTASGVFACFFFPSSLQPHKCSLHQPGASCYRCVNRLSRKCLDKRREVVEHWHTSKTGRRKLGLVSMAHRGRRWSVEGFLQMKPLEMAVMERSTEGKKERLSVGQKA